MGPALSSITTLRISMSDSAALASRGPEAIAASTALLLPFANACPKLARLELPGGVGPELLQAFGSICPHLSSFVATLPALATSTLTQLSVLMPHLTSLTNSWDSKQVLGTRELNASASATCTALNACPRLLHFSHPYPMTATVWAALPHSLTSCNVAEIHQGSSSGLFDEPNDPPRWPHQHTGLRTLEISSSSEYSLQELSLLLAAAPFLAMMVVDTQTLPVSTRKRDGLADNLINVNRSLEAGLQIVTRDANGRLTACKLWIHVRLRDIQKFIEPAILQPLSGLTHMHIPCRYVKADLCQLTYMFPRLKELELEETRLEERDLVALGSCTNLTDLVLKECRGLTCASVAAMCAASSSLRRLSCLNCRYMTAADGQEITREGVSGMVQMIVT